MEPVTLHAVVFKNSKGIEMEGGKRYFLTQPEAIQYEASIVSKPGNEVIHCAHSTAQAVKHEGEIYLLVPIAISIP